MVVTVPSAESKKGAGTARHDAYIEAFLASDRAGAFGGRDVGADLAYMMGILGLEGPLPYPVTMPVDDVLAVYDRCVEDGRGDPDLLLLEIAEFLGFYHNENGAKAVKTVWERLGASCYRLTERQYEFLKKYPKSPLQEAVLNFSAEMGIGLTEASGIRLEDVHVQDGVFWISVWDGNKWREVPFGDGTGEALERWNPERGRIVDAAKKIDREWQDPGTLFLRAEPQGGAVSYDPKGRGLDADALAPLRKAIGDIIRSSPLRDLFKRHIAERVSDDV
ncbi:MAG: hypothetical protein IKP53_04350 [Candidatus Methanomethylophilaceae archaeon]|nr:hypothetical protein [Candidatus Methanomethylophilaceae archaeon]